MYICRIQYNWKQAAGTSIDGAVKQYYNLFYFPNPVQIRVDGQLVQTQPNACIISKPMQPRGFHFPADTTMHWMHNFIQIAPLLERYDIPVGQVFYPQNTSFISEFFRRAKTEFCRRELFREELLDSYVQSFLIQLSRSNKSSDKMDLNSSEHRRFHWLRYQIRTHPEKSWSVEEMAEAVGLSKSRFHAVYKAAFGNSPMQYVIEMKIDRAKTLLRVEELSDLATIAEKLGYKNQYHFIRQFKAVTGMTPGAFRKQKK